MQSASVHAKERESARSCTELMFRCSLSSRQKEKENRKRNATPLPLWSASRGKMQPYRRTGCHTVVSLSLSLPRRETPIAFIPDG